MVQYLQYIHQKCRQQFERNREGHFVSGLDADLSNLRQNENKSGFFHFKRTVIEEKSKASKEKK